MGRAGEERTIETWRVYRTLVRTQVGPAGARSWKAAAAQLIRTGEEVCRRHILTHCEEQRRCLRFRRDGLLGHSDLSRKDKAASNLNIIKTPWEARNMMRDPDRRATVAHVNSGRGS